ncbi:PTS system trehalose-specific EIIBC component [Sporolactobacillus kofuensis]|uniref:protein-N(pi)-phosphohistidine--sucrose phosphotransferase n=1 Tax=Sporolactobacillus kofuensis TaxID=269672 RepID=A0ABW1WFM3_9BACL|nr:PTS system trehalose-specific EIIBC component [Sporolactobacillus kofuensis]MCO7176488.1 PTS system trehalose-specific EIIBC component [Sporolactobacillus kofuensis]
MAVVTEESVKQIIETVGGNENINAATHCVTRLRLILKDENKVDKEKLDKLDLVKGFFSANGQFQIVIGNGTVDKVYDLFVRLTGIGESTKQEVKDAAAEKMNPLQKGIKTLADIFIPILPAIVTAGLLMGINNVLANPGIFFQKSVVEAYPQWKDFADIILVIANTSFVFLPALIGWSAVKKFGGNPLLGIVLGLVLVHPSLLNAYGLAEAQTKGTVPIWNLFGLHIDKVGYQGQVLPVLVASYVLARLELFLKKHVADSIQLLVVAPVALLVTGLLAFTIIGPITLTLANWITAGIVGLFHYVPLLGGLVYGFFYGVLVITGMHQIFLAVDLQLIGSTGSTFLWPMLALSNIAQGAAAFAVFLMARDAKLKGLAMTSSVSAWLGITEPAMFGVNLRFRYPFLAAIISSGIAGAFITLCGVKATSVGIGGLPGFLSIIPKYWGPFFIGMLIVLVLPFVLTYIFSKFSKKRINEE